MMTILTSREIAKSHVLWSHAHARRNGDDSSDQAINRLWGFYGGSYDTSVEQPWAPR